MEPASTSQPVNPASQKKRSGRACDRCRKYRNKCIRSSDNAVCEGCKAVNTECTFEDPNFKRGPPKGYIQAIEHRLKLVETILGSIVASGDRSARDVVENLRKDQLASDVLDRVHSGPYGSPAVRAAEEIAAESPTSPFSAGIRTLGRGSSRPAREPRTERELMTFTQGDFDPPTNWQSLLIGYLGHPITSEGSTSTHSSPINTRDTPDEVFLARTQNFHNLPQPQVGRTSDRGRGSDSSELSFLELAVNGGPIQWGMQPGDSSEWKVLSSAHESTPPSGTSYGEVTWPSSDIQKHLLRLYYDCFHPLFPMVKLATFRTSSTIAPRTTENEFLMLNMFAIASRYSDHARASEAGAMYYSAAGKITSSQTLTLSTCQAMLLHAYYEVSTGSMKKAWVHIGTAIHMGEILHLHHPYGREDFTPAQSEERRNTWWACVILDKFLACSLGTPCIITEVNAYLDIPEYSGRQQVLSSEEIRSLEPEPIRTCFEQMARLFAIIGSVLSELYNESASSDRENRRKVLRDRLFDWRSRLSVDLLADLREDGPPPTLPGLILNASYWSAVILVNRDLHFINDFRHNDTNTLSFSKSIPFPPIVSDDRGHIHSGNPYVPKSLLKGVPRIHSFRAPFNAAMFSEIVEHLKELESLQPGCKGKWRLLVEAKAMLDRRISAPFSPGKPSRLDIPGPPETHVPQQMSQNIDEYNRHIPHASNIGSVGTRDMLGHGVPGVGVPSTYLANFNAPGSAVGPFGHASFHRPAGFGNFESGPSTHGPAARWASPAYDFQSLHGPDGTSAPDETSMPCPTKSPESSLFPHRPWYGGQNS